MVIFSDQQTEAVMYVRGLEQTIADLRGRAMQDAYTLAYRRGYQAGYLTARKGREPDADRARTSGRGPKREGRTTR